MLKRGEEQGGARACGGGRRRRETHGAWVDGAAPQRWRQRLQRLLACIAQLTVCSSLLPGIIGGGSPRSRGSRLPPSPPSSLPLPSASLPLPAASLLLLSSPSLLLSPPPLLSSPPPLLLPLASSWAAGWAATSATARISGPASASASALWPWSLGCSRLRGGRAGGGAGRGRGVQGWASKRWDGVCLLQHSLHNSSGSLPPPTTAKPTTPPPFCWHRQAHKSA